MCGWQVMIKSLSRIFELQSGITFTPFGQIEWGFLLQSPFDMLYPNHSLHFIKNHHIKMAFSMWFEFKKGRKKVTFKNMHFPHIISLALGLKSHLECV